jgi:hypothetical protein
MDRQSQILLTSLLILGCSPGVEQQPSPAPVQQPPLVQAVPIQTDLSKERNKVIDYLKSGEEPTVKDAVWTQDTILKVGVIDNGKNRDGFANYICSVLHDHKFRDTEIWVQIIDIDKVVSEKSFVKIGEAHCTFDETSPAIVEFPVKK